MGTDWQAAEAAAAMWMRANGFPDARLTNGGADGGIDVISAGAVAQVKAYYRTVGRPAVQNLYGVSAAEGRQALFFATAGYTPDALAWAGRVGLPLFNIDLRVGAVTPANAAARDLAYPRAEPRPPEFGPPAHFHVDPSLTHAEQRKAWEQWARPWLRYRFNGPVRRALRTIPSVLTSAEVVEAASDCRHKGRGVLAMTNRRLIVVDRGGRHEWPFHDIHRAELVRRRGGTTLTFVSGGIRWKIKDLAQGGAQAIGRRVNASGLAAPSPASTVPSVNRPPEPPASGSPVISAPPPPTPQIPHTMRSAPSAPSQLSRDSLPAPVPGPAPTQPPPARPPAAAQGVVVGARLLGRGWGWLRSLNWTRAKPYLAAIGVGLIPAMIVTGVAEALWGPWEDDELPDAVALATFAVWIGVGVAFYRYRRAARNRS